MKSYLVWKETSSVNSIWFQQLASSIGSVCMPGIDEDDGGSTLLWLVYEVPEASPVVSRVSCNEHCIKIMHSFEKARPDWFLRQRLSTKKNIETMRLGEKAHTQVWCLCSLMMCTRDKSRWNVSWWIIWMLSGSFADAAAEESFHVWTLGTTIHMYEMWKCKNCRFVICINCIPNTL